MRQRENAAESRGVILLLLGTFFRGGTVPRLYLIPAVALILPILSGCGPKLAQVHGKIMFEGKPVPAGSVTFAPKGEGFEVGKAATGEPDAEGAFQLSTYARNDGALVGPHLVTYVGPQAPETEDPVKRAADMKLHQQFGKLKLPPGHVVEIKSGKNDITLELTR